MTYQSISMRSLKRKSLDDIQKTVRFVGTYKEDVVRLKFSSIFGYFELFEEGHARTPNA